MAHEDATVLRAPAGPYPQSPAEEAGATDKDTERRAQRETILTSMSSSESLGNMLISHGFFPSVALESRLHYLLTFKQNVEPRALPDVRIQRVKIQWMPDSESIVLQQQYIAGLLLFDIDNCLLQKQRLCAMENVCELL